MNDAKKPELTIRDVLDRYDVLLEDVSEQICDNYCKYPGLIPTAEAMRLVCRNCPLDRLKG